MLKLVSSPAQNTLRLAMFLGSKTVASMSRLAGVGAVLQRIHHDENLLSAN